MSRILLVEDDTMIASGILYALETEGYETNHATGIKDAGSLIQHYNFDLAIIDMQLLDGTGFDGFHFHQLRHTYTSNLLSNGAAPKDVQELLGHSDVSTTMNIYAHSTRKAKRDSARLLDKVASNA